MILTHIIVCVRRICNSQCVIIITHKIMGMQPIYANYPELSSAN